MSSLSVTAWVIVLLSVLWLPTGATATPKDHKVTICHVPRGAPQNAHTITVPRIALPFHLLHGDAVGKCVSDCRSDQSSCDDGDLCTLDACMEDGSCVHDVVDCDDGNVCTTDRCQPSTGCVAEALSGVACSDQNACTSGDTCSAGACSGASIPGCCLSDVDCEDGDLCSVDHCSGNTCVSSAKDCSLDAVCGIGGIENACVVGFCDPLSGACSSAQTSCDDGNICTTDLCDARAGCFSLPTSNPPQASESSCDDGLDNDCDGSVDCADGNCAGTDDCGGGGLGEGSVCTGNMSGCAAGLLCCYPCGVFGCEFVCTDPGPGGMCLMPP